MHWSLCGARVCVCVCMCLWACDLVMTSQFNLLKIFVHRALPPPAPPQALNFSTAVCLFSISRDSVLSSSRHGQAISCLFPLIRHLLQVRWVQLCDSGLVEVWRIQRKKAKEQRGWNGVVLLKGERWDMFLTPFRHAEPSGAGLLPYTNPPNAVQRISQ